MKVLITVLLALCLINPVNAISSDEYKNAQELVANNPNITMKTNKACPECRTLITIKVTEITVDKVGISHIDKAKSMSSSILQIIHPWKDERINTDIITLKDSVIYKVEWNILRWDGSKGYLIWGRCSYDTFLNELTIIYDNRTPS